MLCAAVPPAAGVGGGGLPVAAHARRQASPSVSRVRESRSTLARQAGVLLLSLVGMKSFAYRIVDVRAAHNAPHRVARYAQRELHRLASRKRRFDYVMAFGEEKENRGAADLWSAAPLYLMMS